MEQTIYYLIVQWRDPNTEPRVLSNHDAFDEAIEKVDIAPKGQKMM